MVDNPVLLLKRVQQTRSQRCLLPVWLKCADRVRCVSKIPNYFYLPHLLSADWTTLGLPMCLAVTAETSRCSWRRWQPSSCPMACVQVSRWLMSDNLLHTAACFPTRNFHTKYRKCIKPYRIFEMSYLRICMIVKQFFLSIFSWTLGFPEITLTNVELSHFIRFLLSRQRN